MRERIEDNSENGHLELETRFRDEAISYGSSASLEIILAVADKPPAKPPLNRTYLQSLALTKGPVGEVRARHYHEALFMEINAELFSSCLRFERLIAAELQGIARQLSEISKIHRHTYFYQEDGNENATLWTAFDRVEVTVLAIFSILLLIMGVNTTATILHASGSPGFESWLRCYLFSLAPVGLAFVFKGFAQVLQKPKERTLYTVVIWSLGLIFGTLWVLLFANTFSTFTQSASEIINNLSVAHSSSESSGAAGKLFISAAVFTEAFIAAGCWLTMERIIDRHRPDRRVNNPARKSTQEDLDRWVKRKYQQESLYSKIQGKVERIQEAKRLFGDEAIGLFHLALASAEQTQELNQLFKS